MTERWTISRGWDLGDGDDGTEPAPVDHTPSADDPTADDDFARRF